MYKEEILDLEDKDVLASLKNEFIISVLDTDGNITYANTNFYKVFDAAINDKETPGGDLLKSLAPTKEDYIEICKTIHAGFRWQGVLYLKGNNALTYCLETTISPINNEEGDVHKYVAVSNDISRANCKQIDTHNIYNEEKCLFENITKHALFITRKGKIFNISKNHKRITCVSLIGSNIFDFINPLNHDYLKNQIDSVFTEGKTCKYQSLGISEKGNQVFFVSKIKPVFNLQNEVIYATLKSKKHKNGIKVNKELKAIETKYTNIFQSINVGIIVVANANGTIIEWNKGAERAFGYTGSEIIGEHLSIIIPQELVGKGLQELLKAKDILDNNLTSSSIEMVGRKKSGEEFPVEFTMSHWQNGKENFYCAVMIDMSKHKKLEGRLKKTTKDLELFLYRAAHDLKAPLTSAEGLLLLLKDENIPDNAMQLVTMIDETLGKGRMLLDDLALASIISEKSREITPIIFENKIANAITILKEVENFEAIDFQFDIKQKSNFYFNRELMDFIVQNLMRNVIGFIRPQTKEHIPRAHVGVTVTDKELRIVVSDNGVGIGSPYLDKVFDLYFTLCKNNDNSSGMGLYIVKRIVEEFGGDITVKSELNKGTSFQVILPNIKEGSFSDD